MSETPLRPPGLHHESKIPMRADPFGTIRRIFNTPRLRRSLECVEVDGERLDHLIERRGLNDNEIVETPKTLWELE